MVDEVRNPSPIHSHDWRQSQSESQSLRKLEKVTSMAFN